MKKIFIILIVFVAAGLKEKVNAQCTLANPGVKLNYAITEGSNCRIGIDLYFDMIHNPGGKFAWVHIWPSANYSNWGYTNPPTTTNGGLTGSIASFGFEHQQTSLVMQQSYPPDPNAPGFQYQGLVATEGPGILPGSERYTVKNVVLTVPGGCNIPLSFIADVWQSQSAQTQNVHCFSKGLTFFANDPAATGFMTCSLPRTYSFVISTISNTTVNAAYRVFIDNGDGIFNPATDNIQILNGNTVLDAGNNYRYVSGIQTYLPYSGQKPYADRDLWLEVTSASVPNAVYLHIVNSCIPLPVNLTAFTAIRKNERIELTWTTAAEHNNKGFIIQRQTVNTTWENIGFVSSVATNGNSDIPLHYNYTDINRQTGVTQYRLQQTDYDGRNTYSEIRMIKGIDQGGKVLIFPNPSPDGRFTIVSDEAEGELIIRLLDMNGKLVKEWTTIAGHQFTIEHNKSGMYLLQVLQKNTGAVQTVKVMIAR